MKILMTGATSKIGSQLLNELAEDARVEMIYALTRKPPGSSGDGPKFPRKVQFVFGDLLDPQSLESLPSVDLCLHLAALTHSFSKQDYLRINHRGTLELAHHVQKKGCRRFCFVSSQTAGENAGAYALSKFKAEQDLLSMNWEQLLIVRPSEVVGAGSQEGLDRFVELSKSRKIYPWLLNRIWNLHEISFSPLTAHQLNQALQDLIFSFDQGVRLVLIRGPFISSTELARLLFQKFQSWPVPVWIPALRFAEKILRMLKIQLIPPDQIPRLMGQRKQKPNETVKIEEIVVSRPEFF